MGEKDQAVKDRDHRNMRYQALTKEYLEQKKFLKKSDEDNATIKEKLKKYFQLYHAQPKECIKCGEKIPRGEPATVPQRRMTRAASSMSHVPSSSSATSASTSSRVEQP